DCVYCQLGSKPGLRLRRFSGLDFNKLKSQLSKAVKSGKKIDYITISGSGEPTLVKGLKKIIAEIKKISNERYPVCVITNSSLLYLKSVRKELMAADLIIPSLDAASEKTFCKINRPHKSISLHKVIEGLMKLSKEFKGAIWLEIMLVKGYNDSLSEAKKFKKIISKLKPDKVQLNLPIRPPAENINIPDKTRVEEIKKIISESAEVVVDNRRKQISDKSAIDLEGLLLNFLKVRPATVDDLESSLGLNAETVSKELKTLKRNKQIKEIKRNKKKYFVIR
ncbi:MAG: radical SAM protein, partial [Candidatus Omnitrophica bacterium]|nr:radical SAM protein [Candidatus Omnitrophota bacterium]